MTDPVDGPAMYDTIALMVQKLSPPAPPLQTELAPRLERILRSLSRIGPVPWVQIIESLPEAVARGYLPLVREFGRRVLEVEAVVDRRVGPDALDEEMLSALVRSARALIAVFMDKVGAQALKNSAVNAAQLAAFSLPDIDRELRFEEQLGQLAERQQALDAAVEKASLVADQAEATVTDAEQRVEGSAARTGEVSVAIHYQAYARAEKRSADGFRIGALVLVALAALAAFILGGEQLTASDITQRLVVVLPAIGLAGYAAREASKHRRLADWAKARAIQLLTFELYTLPLPNDERASLRAAFGGKVFGELPPGPATPDSDAVTVPQALIDQVLTQALKPPTGRAPTA